MLAFHTANLDLMLAITYGSPNITRSDSSAKRQEQALSWMESNLIPSLKKTTIVLKSQLVLEALRH